jgi:hypothetical protein
MNRNMKPSNKEKMICVINAWVFPKFFPKVWVIKLVELATAAIMHNNSPVRVGWITVI